MLLTSICLALVVLAVSLRALSSKAAPMDPEVVRRVRRLADRMRREDLLPYE